jgi:hypothetical protein
MFLSRRFLATYVFFVGVPLLLLVGILHLGRSLTAPVLVEGTWDFLPQAPQPAVSLCGSKAVLTNSVMAIAQSGQVLSIDLHPLMRQPALGRIQGVAISATAPQAAASARGCKEPQSFSMKGTVDSGVKPATISGELRFDGCPYCAPVTFRAVRRTPAEGGL